MSKNAIISTIKSSGFASEEDMINSIRQVYSLSHIEESDYAKIYSRRLNIRNAWSFLIGALGQSKGEKGVDYFAPTENVLIWTVRGRHFVTGGDDLVYINKGDEIINIYNYLRNIRNDEIKHNFSIEYDIRRVNTENDDEAYRIDNKELAISKYMDIWNKIVAFYEQAYHASDNVAIAFG